MIVNGSIDLNQPAVSNVDSIIVYGSKANDRITIDPSLTMPVTLSGGTGGNNVLTAGGGPTREQGWYGTTVEKQGESDNFLFGQAGTSPSSRARGPATSSSPARPYHAKGHSRIRRIPPPPKGTFSRSSGDKLVKTSNPYHHRRPTTKRPRSTE